MNTQNHQQLSYRPDIDGLRAIAVLGVLLFHLNPAYLPGGFVGVDIFFVISGYLITRIILKELDAGTFTFAYFYERRVRRIFPALFFMLAICTPLAYLTLYADAFITYIGDLKYAAAQIANIHFGKDVDYFSMDAEQSPLLHTWSLGVEEQFYIIWPALLLLCYKMGKKGSVKWAMAGLAVLSLALSQILIAFQETNQAFYMLYARAYELAIGGMLALPAFQKNNFGQKGNELWALSGIALIALSYILITKQVMFPGVTALVPTFGTAFVIYAHMGGASTWVSRMLSWRPVIYIGLISYSLYLWHWPFIAMYDTYMQGAAMTPIAALVIAGVSILCAMVSHRFIEKPFRKYRKDGERSHKWRVFGAALLCIICFVVVSEQWKAYAVRNIPLNRPFTAEPVSARTEEIRYYNSNGQKQAEVIVTGDSHSGHYLEGVITWAKARNMSVAFVSRAACQMVGGEDEQVSDKRKCRPFHAALPSAIENDGKPIKYFIIGQRLDTLILDTASDNIGQDRVQTLYERNAPTLLKAYEVTINAVQKAQPQAKVIIMGQVPKLKEEPAHCDQRKNTPINQLFDLEYACDPYEIDTRMNPEVIIPFNNELESLASRYDHVEFFDPHEIFEIGKEDEWGKYYRDDDHINPDGSNYVETFFDFDKK